MVAITQMSNVLGTLVPVKEVVRIAHARGIPVLVDGAQGAVHLDVDVQDLDCDFYAFTGHKLYGPTGIGVLYGKYEHLAAMPPFNGGGEMIQEVSRRPHHLWRAAAPVRGRHAGDRRRRSGSAPRSTTSTRSARTRIRAHETELVRYAHERLTQINSLRIIGNARDKGADRLVRDRRARIRTTSPPSSTAPASPCAPAPIARCRCWRASASPPPAAPRSAMYNTKGEVDALAEALIKAQEFFA